MKSDMEINFPLSEAGLRDYLREIRAALGDDATTPQLVETVRGCGSHKQLAFCFQPKKIEKDLAVWRAERHGLEQDHD